METKKRTRKHTIDRTFLLNIIYEDLVQYIVWNDIVTLEYHNIAVTHLAHADGLIAAVETSDCGSIGGYDKGQPRCRSILDRFEWIYCKYNDLGDLENYEQVAEYYAATVLEKGSK